MKIEFTLNLPTMPKGTAQQKGEKVVVNGGRGYVIHYKKKSVAEARRIFETALRPYVPDEPMSKPVRITAVFYFDVKNKSLWGKLKPTKPDGDGYVKEFWDAMESMKFFKNDSQLADQRIIKRYAERASIYVRAEEIDE